MHHLPRTLLANLPTPIHEAVRLSKALGGPAISIKRDDLTGLATGGNKTRKLEFLVADAMTQGADSLITAGGVQSNHCRQTAAAAAACGLECHLVFGGAAPPRAEGNYLLDRILGARVHWTEKRLRNQTMEDVASELRQAGRRPYVIPVGGSNVTGAFGYVAAMSELSEQLARSDRHVDQIVFATSSGGTQAGLVAGARLTGFRGRLRGISIDQLPDDQTEDKYRSFVHALAVKTAHALGLSATIELDEIEINYDYLGAGYGVVGDLERDAVALLARTEGILVGPVYTARALGALIDMVRRGELRKDEHVLFWHTGDDVALHAYAEEFSSL